MLDMNRVVEMKEGEIMVDPNASSKVIELAMEYIETLPKENLKMISSEHFTNLVYQNTDIEIRQLRCNDDMTKIQDGAGRYVYPIYFFSSPEDKGFSLAYRQEYNPKERENWERWLRLGEDY